MANRRPTLNSFYAATPNFEAGKDTPRAFLERCLDAIAEFEPEVGAFVYAGWHSGRDGASVAAAHEQSLFDLDCQIRRRVIAQRRVAISGGDRSQ